MFLGRLLRVLSVVFFVMIIGSTQWLVVASATVAYPEAEYEIAQPILLEPVQSTRVDPSINDLASIAEARGVPVDQVSPLAVNCWQNSYTLNHDNYWVRLTMNWCYDNVSGSASNIWGYGTIGSSGSAGSALTEFVSTTGSQCGPLGGPYIVAQCHQQWHFRFLGGLGVPAKNYYPWITVTGSTGGGFRVTYQY